MALCHWALGLGSAFFCYCFLLTDNDIFLAEDQGMVLMITNLPYMPNQEYFHHKHLTLILKNYIDTGLFTRAYKL